MKCDDCDKPAEFLVGHTSKVCEKCLGFTVAELLPDPKSTKTLSIRRVPIEKKRKETS